MIEQPDDNPHARLSPGHAQVPSPVAVTLPDGRRLEFAEPVTGGEIAAAIGSALAKEALAIRVDGKPRDLATVVDRDAAITVITGDTPEGLQILRHDAAHVMAEAAKELYSDIQVTFGPATETGFYYDFARSEPFTPDDLEKIELRMREIVRRDEKITREVWDRDAAVAFFARLARNIRPNTSPRSRRARRSASTGRAALSISASARICHRPAISAKPLS